MQSVGQGHEEAVQVSICSISISHPTDCQSDTVRTAAFRTVVRDWEETWGMHESTKILCEQTGHFQQAMVWVPVYTSRQEIEL